MAKDDDSDEEGIDELLEDTAMRMQQIEGRIAAEAAAQRQHQLNAAQDELAARKQDFDKGIGANKLKQTETTAVFADGSGQRSNDTLCRD